MGDSPSHPINGWHEDPDLFTKGSTIERTYSPENLPYPLFTKEGVSSLCKACLPVGRGGEEGFSLQCLHDYGLISKSLQMNYEGLHW